MKKTNLLILLLLLGTQIVYAQYSEVRTEAEIMPLYPDCVEIDEAVEQRQCSNQSLVNHIAEFLKYPDAARVAGIEGTVYASFVVDELGRVGEAKLIRDIGYGCGEAALAAIGTLPQLQPASDRGARVRVRMNVPIVFSLQRAEADRNDGYRLSWGGHVESTITKEQLSKLLDREIFVRDLHGNQLTVDELAFSYQRNDKLQEARSPGTINNKLRELAHKVKRGGEFTLYVAVQDNGEFIYLTRTYRIVE